MQRKHEGSDFAAGLAKSRAWRKWHRKKRGIPRPRTPSLPRSARAPSSKRHEIEPPLRAMRRTPASAQNMEQRVPSDRGETLRRGSALRGALGCSGARALGCLSHSLRPGGKLRSTAPPPGSDGTRSVRRRTPSSKTRCGAWGGPSTNTSQSTRRAASCARTEDTSPPPRRPFPSASCPSRAKSASTWRPGVFRATRHETARKIALRQPSCRGSPAWAP